MTITPESAKREISDLQRLLLSLGLMKFTNATQSGKWGAETQDAVVALYEQLGWDHAENDKWITSPAMAAATGLHACWHANAASGGESHAGGGGSHASGGGSHAGGGGSHASGGGSHAGGGGSHASGGGSHAGGGGSHASGGGSHAGGGGSHASGGGSHAGGGGSHAS